MKFINVSINGIGKLKIPAKSIAHFIKGSDIGLDQFSFGATYSARSISKAWKRKKERKKRVD